MSSRDKLKANLKSKSATARRKADALMAEDLALVQCLSKDALEAIRIEISDQFVYDELIEIIEEATKKNVAVAEFQDRLEEAGVTTKDIFKEVVGIAKAII